MPGWDGEGTLHCYLLDYLHKRNFVKAARAFAEESGTMLEASVPIDAPQGLLFEWWSVFWDVFLAHTGKSGNRFAAIYVQSNANKGIAGSRPAPGQPAQAIQAPPTPQMMAQAAQAYPQAQAQPQPPSRQVTAVNGHPGPAQMGIGPPPAAAAARARMTQNQYNQSIIQHQQNAVRAAAQQHLQQPGQAPQQQHPAAAQQQPPQPNMMHQAAAAYAQSGQQPRSDQELSREFLNECMVYCGLGGRDVNNLSDDESLALTNVIRRAQAEEAQRAHQARLMQHQQQQQQQQQQAQQHPQPAPAQAQVAMYGPSAPTPNGNYYYGPGSPAPQAATPMAYQASPPPSAPAMQAHFSQPAMPASAGSGPGPRRPGRQAGAAANALQHASAPPTPELSSGNAPPTASPRGRKRPRMEGPPAATTGGNMPQTAPSPFDPYMANAPQRPSSAASARGSGAASSPHMPPQYAAMPQHIQSGSMNENDELARQAGPNGKVNVDRKRSPMAPPPLPVSQNSTVSTLSLGGEDGGGASGSRPTSGDHGSPTAMVAPGGLTHASPISMSNGLVGSAPGSASRAIPGVAATAGSGGSSASFYGLSGPPASVGLDINGVTAPSVSTAVDSSGIFDHAGDFNIGDLTGIDFDMSAYINVGGDEYSHST